MSRRIWLLLALLLPLVVLGGNIARQQFTLQGASVWRIPISGYDPRDPLRGHYVRFSYDWQLQGDAQSCLAGACELCLRHDGDTVIAAVRTGGERCPARIDVVASGIAVQPLWPSRQLAFTSRIFVSEASAPAVRAELQRQPMQVVALIDGNGRLVNRRLQAHPKGGE